MVWVNRGKMLLVDFRPLMVRDPRTLASKAKPAPCERRVILAPTVNLLAFAEALHLAGLVPHYDAARGVTVISPDSAPTCDG